MEGRENRLHVRVVIQLWSVLFLLLWRRKCVEVDEAEEVVTC